MNPPRPSLLERFEAKVDKVSSENGCWLWTGGYRNGYGTFHFKGTRAVASRWAYMHYKGEIPQGAAIRHACGIKQCVNPEHLELSAYLGALPTDPTLMEVFMSKVDQGCQSEDCWLWTGGRVKRGYGELYYHRKPLYAHRTSYELFIGEIPDGLFVCHHCDNPICVNPAHLFLGTPKDNAEDMMRKGRSIHQTTPGFGMRGEQNGFSKLTELQVREIRKLFAAGGVSKRGIARQFGVGSSIVGDIIARRRWKHVED